MRIQPAVLEDDVGLALDVRDEELGSGGQRGGDAVDGSIPAGGRFLRTVAAGDLVAVLFEMASQAGIAVEIDQAAGIGKWIDDAQSLPYDLTGFDILGRHQT